VVKLPEVIGILSTIAGIITSLGVIIGAFFTVSKWGKRKVSNWFSHVLNDVLEEKLEPVKRVGRRTLREDIENTCEKYRSQGFITPDEHRELTKAKEDYVAINGNGSIVCIVNGTLSLPIKG